MLEWLEPAMAAFLEREGYVSVVVEEEAAAVADFENNCSELRRLNLILTDANGRNSNRSVVAKLSSEAIMELKPILKYWELFRREIGIYTEILKPMEETYRANGFDLHWPECLGYREYDILVLEDLKEKGYSVVDRHEGFDWEHLSLVVRELAKFHSVSAVCQQKRIIDMTKYPNYPFNSTEKHNLDYFIGSFRSIRDLTAPRWPEAARLKYAGIVEKLPDIASEELRKVLDIKSCFKVPNHGDCWVNNICFKYDEVTGKPVNLKFVDYQMSHYNSFAMDLHYLLGGSPRDDCDNKETMDLLLAEYHNSLESALKILDYKQDVPTLEEVKAEFEATKFFRLFSICVLLPVFRQNDERRTDSSPLKGVTGKRLHHRFTDENMCRLLLRKFDDMWDAGLFDAL